MLAVIGSQAAISNSRRFNRVFADLDMVGLYDNAVLFLKQYNAKSIYPIDNGNKLIGLKSDFDCPIEIEIAWPGSLSEQLLHIIYNDEKSIDTPFGVLYCKTASLDVLLMLKLTHRFKKNSPHFLKTMRDIQLLRKMGAMLRDEHRSFFEARMKNTLNYGKPNLKTTKKEFFGRDDIYTYDHDDIHKAVASLTFMDYPAYSYFKVDGEEVLTSKTKFERLPYTTQLRAVYEESCVLALERSQIPYPLTDVKDSFLMALEKVCTSITSGWFREFSWENYDAVISLYDELTCEGLNYKSMFDSALESGMVRLF